MAPRPVLAAMKEQQDIIRQQAAQIQWLYKAVNKLAYVAGLRVTADETNPAEPIPSPGSEAPYTTLDKERQPEARGDVAGIGGVPGATDVGADSTTTVDQIGGIQADTPYNVSENVTKPVSGTEDMRPLDEVRTVPEIQFGNPMKPDAAFPLQGEWANSRQTVGSQDRAFAALRLARLRIQAGMSQDDELVLAQAIASNTMTPDAAIANEIETLSQVVRAQSSRTASAPARRTMSREAGARSVPSMTSAPVGLSTSAGAIDDSQFAFE